MSKAKYRLIMFGSMFLFLIGVSLIIYAAYLQSIGYSDELFNLFGVAFFIIMIIILAIYLSHDEELSAYQIKRKEERLKKGFLSTYIKEDTINLVQKRLAFHGFNEINDQFLYYKKLDKFFGNTEFYVRIVDTNDFVYSLKETQELYLNIRKVGPSYGRIVRNCVLVGLRVDEVFPHDMLKLKEMINHYVSLEEFGDSFIPFLYDLKRNQYYFRDVENKLLINNFYFGTKEFKKYVFGPKAKFHITLNKDM
jgi:hypothetical protein